MVGKGELAQSKEAPCGGRHGAAARPGPGGYAAPQGRPVPTGAPPPRREPQQAARRPADPPARPRGRGQYGPLPRAKRSLVVRTRRKRPPLPWGEGRGEGTRVGALLRVFPPPAGGHALTLPLRGTLSLPLTLPLRGSTSLPGGERFPSVRREPLEWVRSKRNRSSGSNATRVSPSPPGGESSERRDRATSVLSTSVGSVLAYRMAL